MNQEPEPDRVPGWRKRHPALARSLLYGAGLLLLALAAWLLARRSAQDRQDRLDFLRARLDALDVLAVSDATGDEVAKVLDEVFADPDLPPLLRQRALRARAFNHLKQGDPDAALGDLDAAAGLPAGPVERAALSLERAQALVVAKRFDDATAALDASQGGSHPVLAIWRGLLRAQVLDGRGQRDAAVLALDASLEALPRPLPASEALVVCQTPWTPAEAAIQATKALADLRGGAGTRDPRAWERLLGLAPRDLVAALEAAKALARGGHEEEAARAWAWAVSLNGGRAPDGAASDPDLAPLEKKREEGLKVGMGPGR